jgi:hypothetical protein
MLRHVPLILSGQSASLQSRRLWQAERLPYKITRAREFKLSAFVISGTLSFCAFTKIVTSAF